MIGLALVALASASLSFHTVHGGPAGPKWEVQFRVPHTPKGWVVQKVTGEVVFANGHTVTLKPIWEAFAVRNGLTPDHDVFARVDRSIIKVKIHAVAYRYDDMRLPRAFRRTGQTGDAYATHVDPQLPIDGQTPVVRDFEAHYEPK